MGYLSMRRPDNDEWFVLALTFVFVGLKVTGYIDWLWWWVASPLWIYAIVLVIIDKLEK